MDNTDLDQPEETAAVEVRNSISLTHCGLAVAKDKRIIGLFEQLYATCGFYQSISQRGDKMFNVDEIKGCARGVLRFLPSRNKMVSVYFVSSGSFKLVLEKKQNTERKRTI